MPLTEKTFELNITHEILNHVDQLHGFFQAVLWRYGTVSTPPISTIASSTAIGLSLGDEKRKGWDVRIELPAWFHNPRALFIQYKLGRHAGYARTGTIFRGHWRRPNPHCVFEINNNRDLDQHVRLRALANNPAQSRAVYYALPRITTGGAFRAWAGRLCQMTTFLAIPDVEQLAQTANLTISYGQKHLIRTCYTQVRREIQSDPIDASTLPDAGPELIAEIIALRAWRTLVAWTPTARESRLPHPVWSRTFEIWLNQLRQHWSPASAEEVTSHGRYPDDLHTRALSTARTTPVDPEALISLARTQGERLVAALDERIFSLRRSVVTGEWLDKVPSEPRARFTMELADDRSIRLGEMPGEDPDAVEWGAISMQII